MGNNITERTGADVTGLGGLQRGLRRFLQVRQEPWEEGRELG